MIVSCYAVAMISIILPAMDEEPAAVETLAALVAGVADGVVRDAIVVSSKPSALLEQYADAAGCLFAVEAGRRPALIRCGAALIRSDWSLVITAGLVPSGDWLHEIDDWLSHHPNSHEAAYFPYRPRRGLMRNVAAMAMNIIPLLSGKPHPLHGVLTRTTSLRTPQPTRTSLTRLRAPMLDRRTLTVKGSTPFGL
jgi:hypothetical protein